MTDPDPKDRLDALEKRLAEKRAAGGTRRSHQEERYSQAQDAWRMVTELVAGLMVGFAMGYGIDIVLGTAPWFMLVFTLLGLAAGVLALVRTAQDAQRRQEARVAGRDQGAPAAHDDDSAEGAQERTDDGD